MVVTHTHAKDHSQRSVSLKDKVETDEQTYGKTNRCTEGEKRLHYLPR